MKSFAVFMILVLSLTACTQAVNSSTPLLIPPTITPLPSVTPTSFPPFPSLTPTKVPLAGSGGGVIAYASWVNYDWQIHAVNADGSGDQRVDKRHGYEPNWSPDGRFIIFQYTGLWIAELASGVITQVPISVEGTNLPNEYLVKPAWSPDGQWIAFLNENGFQGDLYLVHPDGTDLQRLTTTNDISRDGNLVWSPDGKQIAYSADRDGNIEIYVLDIAEALQGNEEARQLTNTAMLVRNLVTSWSGNGSWLAFSSTRDGNTEIYLVEPEGSNLVRLTNNPAYDGEPAWSPDGKFIAFSSDRDRDVEIYIMNVESAIQNADDSNVRRVTNHPGDDVGPVWRPGAD